jgi:hypothetical protein
MAELWIANIEDGTTDDEIKALLVRYGFPHFDRIQHVPGDGSRPAVLLSFDSTEPMALRALQPRIHHLFWKNRTINVMVVQEHGG